MEGSRLSDERKVYLKLLLSCCTSPSGMTPFLLIYLGCSAVLGLRNYTFGIKVFTFGGSGDTFHFRLCNATSSCLDWYPIVGGLKNGGQWYNFDYPEQPDIGTVSSAMLYQTDNDQLCVSQISVDDSTYVANSGNLPQCMEVSDSKPSGSCYVIDVVLATEDCM